VSISRLDLDGAGSPNALVTRIFQLEPNLPIPVPIEQLCQQFDITSIGDLNTDGFEAALVTNEVKSEGAILVAKGRSRQRRRFSIAHELGHFLIPAHLPRVGEPSFCSAEHLRAADPRDEDRRRRMEAEANRFAALLLMPPPVLRAELQKIRRPDVVDIVRLAELFDVSKDALARAYADYTREAVAIIVIHKGRIARSYRNERNFPWLAVSRGQSVPAGSVYHGGEPSAARSPVEECEADLWLSEVEARKVASMTEQVLHQQNGFALLMLHADLVDEDDEERPHRPSRW
jgi:Zn-dependent peptidase ImmA (M78 family)